MKKIASLLLATALLLSVPVGCGGKNDDLLENVRKKGKLTIAMEGTWAPWTYHDESDKLVGFDVEIGQYIADSIGVEADFVEGEWDGLFAGMDAGLYDMVINGVDSTPERAEKYDFSEPYAYIHTVLVTHKDNTDITSFEDLKGKTTANSIGSTYMELGEKYGAAVSTSTTVNWLVHSIPYGFAVGLLSLLSQANGRGEHEEMKRLSALGLRLSVWLGLALTAICMAISPFLPVWMQAAPEIRRSASLYFFIVSVPLMFSVITSILASAMHAVKDTRTPMIINLSANALNVLLNYLLIYRLSLGVLGGVGMFVAFRCKATLRFGWNAFFVRQTAQLKALLRVALPVTSTSVVSCAGYIVFAGMVSGMSVVTFAAHSIAVTAEEIFYLPGYGIRTATSALIGTAIGEQNERKFRDTRSVSLWLTIVLMLLSGMILFFTAYPLMRLFTSSETVAQMGAQVLRIVAFSEPFFGLMVAWEGISYGTGHTRSVFVIEALSMWGVRILLTWLVVRAGYGLNAVWYCMIADNVTKAVALTVKGLMARGDGVKSKISIA